MAQYRWHFAFFGWVLLVAIYVLLTQPPEQSDKPQDQPEKPLVEKMQQQKPPLQQKLPQQTVAKITLPPPPALPEPKQKPKSKQPPQSRPQPEIALKPSKAAEVERVVEVKAEETVSQVKPKPVIKKTIAPPHNVAQPSTEHKLRAEQHQASGKRVLAMLESGKGPTIHIQWPNSERDREWIKQRLYQCGVKLGKYHRGRLTAIEQSYRDFSGFIRIPDDRLNAGEQSRLAHLNGVGTVVRVFPRYLDVNMLAGLSVLNADTLQSARNIRIRYVREPAGLAINGVQVDGKSIPQRFMLLGNRHCSAS